MKTLPDQLLVGLCLACPLLSQPLHARPRPPLPPLPERTLSHWGFDQDLPGYLRAKPLLGFEQADCVESWSGYALRRLGEPLLPVAIPLIDPGTGRTNLPLTIGSIRFWFRIPLSTNEDVVIAGDGTAADVAGDGFLSGMLSNALRGEARLLEFASLRTATPQVWWALSLDAVRQTVCLSGHGGRGPEVFMTAPVALGDGAWHLFTISFTVTNSVLYVDGEAVAAGNAMPAPPVWDRDYLGLVIGSDVLGANPAGGDFEELAAFALPIGAKQAAMHYRAHRPFTALGPFDTLEKERARLAARQQSSASALAMGSQMVDGGEPADSDPLLNGPQLSYGPGDLWLEIPLPVTAEIKLLPVVLHGALSAAVYELLSKSSLADADWAVEQTLIGAPDQDWTATTVPLNGRTNLFLRARFAGDSDGDGLPDWYELEVTHTDPQNPDTGDTGVSDGYKDADNDGWFNLDELRNGTNPNAFNTPPPPQITRIRLDNSWTNITIEWQVGRGAEPESYVVERATWSGYEQVAQVLASARSCTLAYDTPLFGTQWIGPAYRVRAVGVTSWSSASALRPVKDPALGLDGARMMETGSGAWLLILPQLPGGAERVRVAWDGGTETDEWLDLSSTALAAGQIQLNSSQVAQMAGKPVFVQAATADGRVGRESYVGHPGSTTTGAAAATHLKENLKFYLRAATVAEPFGCFVYTPWGYSPWSGYLSRQGTSVLYEHSDYWQYDATWDYLSRVEAAPVELNHLWRNFALDFDYVDADGHLLTGAYFDPKIGTRSLNDPVFHLDTYPSGQTIPLALVSSNAPWLYYRWADGELPEVGLALDSNTNLFLLPNQHNLFGLPIQSLVLTSYDTNWLLRPGAASGAWPWANCFVGTAEPQLQTMDYYFTSQTPCQQFYPNGPARPPCPGTLDFSPANTTGLLITGVGQPFSLMGWAKQRIVNGDQNRFAYLGQYFEAAYVLRANGEVTTNHAGFVSQYGDFLPMQPGPAAVVTLPDLDTGQRGTAVVQVIKLQLDVNHDGVMDATFGGPNNTSPGQPFVFWVNDDWDDSFAPSSPTSTEKEAIGTFRDVQLDPFPDLIPQTIGSDRDLEDFARLWVCGMPSVPRSEGYRVTLSWRYGSGPGINIYVAADPDGSDSYVRSTSAAAVQLTGYRGPSLPTFGRKVGFVGPNRVWEVHDPVLLTNRTWHLLFEGYSKGAGELVLRIEKSNQVLAECSAWIDLRQVNELYEQILVENAAYEPTLTGDGSSRGDSSWRRIGQFSPAEPAKPAQSIVFVHGWRMSQQDYEQFSATLYKRLWWQGYQGRLSAIRWHTLSNDDFNWLKFRSLFTYNQSEYRAYRSGRGVADYLKALRAELPDSAIGVCAHSMGNVVMAQALRLLANESESPIDNYVMMQAAMPAHAYDPTLPDYARLSATNLAPAPDAYRGYAVGITNAVRNRIWNFFNAKDFALATGWAVDPALGIPITEVNWEYNQQAQKPVSLYNVVQRPVPGSFDWYRHSSTCSVREVGTVFENQNYPGNEHYYTNVPSYSRAVTLAHEKLACVARSRSKAVGAMASVGGQVGEELNLATPLLENGIVGFDRGRNEHSGQFNWNIQRVWGFYEALWASLVAEQ